MCVSLEMSNKQNQNLEALLAVQAENKKEILQIL